MTKYANTRFTGFFKGATAVSAVPVTIPIKLQGDSSEYTVLEDEGLSVEWFRMNRRTAGDVNLYLSYDDDGVTQHVMIDTQREPNGWGFTTYSLPAEIHTTYPAPAGKTWKVWVMGPNSTQFSVSFGGSITNKQ